MEKGLSDFLIILSTVDPIGTLALFVALTAQYEPGERMKIAFRAVGYATVILLVSLVAGQFLLGKLGVPLASFQLAGAIIFFLFGVQMVFGSGAGDPSAKVESGHDAAVFPLAVPSLASPGSILAVVVLTDNNRYSIPEQAFTGGALLLVMAITLLVLLLANRIFRIIGHSGASLLVRVLGLILAALAVDMGFNGILGLMELIPDS